MGEAAEVTVVAKALRQRRRRRITLLLAVVAVLAALCIARSLDGETAHYADIREHFKYGSIGSEPESGLPYWVWKALPILFAEELAGRGADEAFGFLYEPGRDLPVGFSKRRVLGVDLVWLNCAVCHSGTVSLPDGERRLVLGMPANNLDLYGFIRFVLSLADSPKLAPGPLLDAMATAGADLGWLERLYYRAFVIPQLRSGLRARRDALMPLLEIQQAWGPGRVDTFNPYKLIHFGQSLADLDEKEIHGPADFPSIFLQRDRDGMQLHWDGNNPSLAERNLSAALGAGVTEESVDHAAIERVATWLLDLEPPENPYRQRAERDLWERGRGLYMSACVDCHGYFDGERYVFTGARLGQVVKIDEIGSDPGRLDSYTAELAERQRDFFRDDPRYAFRHFTKTDGYANQPLDGLWLRAPYLHNGAVPNLRALLQPPGERPARFLRDSDAYDFEVGGFRTAGCPAPEPGSNRDPSGEPFCFDTEQRGNARSGHDYGTGLSDDDKAALLEYLKTF